MKVFRKIRIGSDVFLVVDEKKEVYKLMSSDTYDLMGLNKKETE